MPPRKLTDADVLAIRNARAAGALLAPLAAKYNVTVDCISAISMGRARTKVGGPLTGGFKPKRRCKAWLAQIDSPLACAHECDLQIGHHGKHRVRW